MHALREQAETGGDKVAVCWWYGHSYDVSSRWTAEERQKRPNEHSQHGGRDKAERSKSRPQRGGGFRQIFILCMLFRGDLVCVIAQGISRYIVTSCPVSCDITRYGISRYRIISISRIFATDMEISYPVDLFLDTEHYFLPVRCTKLGAPRE